MHLHFDIHKIHILREELSEVYANLVLQSFGISLVAIFIPIHLLSAGFSFSEVIVFLMAFYATLGFFSPVSAALAKRLGFKHIILLRTPLLIIFLLGLKSLNSAGLTAFALAFVGGISSSLYWISVNSLFAKYSDKLHRGRQSGKLISLPQLAALTGPTIGGILSYFYGFGVLFAVSGAIVLLSVLPLFFTGETKPHINISLKKIMSNHTNLKYAIYFVLDSPKFVAGVIFWPLFVYWGLNESAAGTGISGTLAGLGALAFTYYVGKKSDRENKIRMIKKGAILVALLWFARIFADSTAEFFLYSFLAGLFTVLIDVPFMAVTFDHASRNNSDEFIVFREMFLGVGRVASLALTLIVSDTIMRIIFSFSLAGTATLAFLLF